MRARDLDTSLLLRISGLRQLLQFVIEFTVSVIVARLLTPAEIGTFSVAMASVFVATALRSGGISTYIIQCRTLAREQVGSALGFAIAVAVTLALLVLLVRHFVAEFYAAPVMAPLLLVVAGTVLIAPLQGVASGLLLRELRIGRTAIADVSGSATGAAVTLSLAFSGAGPIALAWGALANIAVVTTIYGLFAPALLWTRPRLTGWLEVCSVSGWAMGAALATQFGERSSELVVGKTLSLADAALLERAMSLPRMIWRYLMPPVLNILAPVVAHELRGGADARDITVRRMRYFGCVFVPILLGMASQSEHLLLVLFGPQWTASIVPAKWVCLASAISGQFVVINATLYAMGRTREAFIANAVEQASRIVVLVLLATISIAALAAGFVAVSLCYAVAIVAVAQRCDVLHVTDLPRAILPGVIAGAVIYGVGVATDVGLAKIGVISHLAALLVAIAVLALALGLLLRAIEPDVLRFVWKVVRMRGSDTQVV